MPIKYQAAVALAKLLLNGGLGNTARDVLKPSLASMLEIYLQLMEEIDSEELMMALEDVIDSYSKYIEPYAVQLCQQLANRYKLLTVKPEAADDANSSEEEERNLAATACVTTINQIVVSCSKNKSCLRTILPIIYPILVKSLTRDGEDIIKDSLDAVNYIIYYGYDRESRVPAELWKLLPQMFYITAGKEDNLKAGLAIDYLDLVTLITKNFINRDPQSLLSVGEGQTETYFALMMKFVKKILLVN